MAQSGADLPIKTAVFRSDWFTMRASTTLPGEADSTDRIPESINALVEIDRLLGSGASCKEAEQTVEGDHAVATRVLRLVNSSAYGLQGPITTTGDACNLLGLQAIKSIIVQVKVHDAFVEGRNSPGIDIDWLWEHSLKTALAAKLLVESVPNLFGLDSNEAYTCGLLHDVGKLVLVERQPEKFAEAQQLSRKKRIPLAKAEVEVFGFSHARVGGVLIESWGLPTYLQDAVMHHHGPVGQAKSWIMGFLVHAANSLAHGAADGTGGWTGERADPEAMKMVGISQLVQHRVTTAVKSDRFRFE